jgi:hypothetical protein
LVPGQNPVPVDDAGDATAGLAAESLAFGERNSTRARCSDDGAGQWMLAVSFKAGT